MTKISEDHSPTPADPRVKEMCDAMATVALEKAVEHRIRVGTITIIVSALTEQDEKVLSVSSTGYETPQEMIEGTLAFLVESALSVGLLPGMGGTTEPPDGFPPGGFVI